MRCCAEDLNSTDPTRKYVLDHADDMTPTRQHELDPTDQECICPELSESCTGSVTNTVDEVVKTQMRSQLHWVGPHQWLTNRLSAPSVRKRLG